MYLEYDFIDRKVCPTDYSIRSRPDGEKGFANLLSWIIEGRNKKDENWTTLDKRENDETIDGPLLQNTFKIRLNKEFRFFRFLRIGCINNGHNDHVLVLSALEFFGSLIENK